MAQFFEPLEVLGTGGYCINDEEDIPVHEDASGFQELRVRVDQSPNPAGRIFVREVQRAIVDAAYEIPKLEDAASVE